MEAVPSPEERKRRARAAWSYSALGQREVAARTGINYETLRGLLARSGPAPSAEQAWAIADACGAPLDFINAGWQRAVTAARVQVLEDNLSALREQMTGMALALAALSVRVDGAASSDEEAGGQTP